MGIRVPRITVNADFGDDTAFGDLSLLSVGYGPVSYTHLRAHET